MSNYGKQGDFLYDSTDLTIWTTVETCVGIIAACFPCLKPLFKAVLSGSLLSKTGKSHTGYNRQDLKSDTNGQDQGVDKEEFEMYGKRGSTELGRRDLDMETSNNSGSEESILRQPPQMKGSGGGGIVKTTQVRVDYEAGDMPSGKYRI